MFHPRAIILYLRAIFLRPIGAIYILFGALVREEAIFAVCKRFANEGFALPCKEKSIGTKFLTAG